MRNVVLSLLAFLAPTAAFALTAQDKVDIAQRLSKAYPAITVTVESSPVISGDKDPTIFRISPSGKAQYGKLFEKGRYDIIHKPDSNEALGGYLCDIADEFVRERQKARADFLPKFQFKVGASVREVNFEFSGDQDTVRAIIYSFILLYDYLKDDYGKFNILVRGYADRGASSFQGKMMPQYPYHDLSYFPLKDPADPLLAIYLRKLEMKKIGNTYTNAELPNLRGTFLKHVIDRFLDECRLTRTMNTEAFVLDGAVIDEKAPDYRSIDLYFYAYR